MSQTTITKKDVHVILNHAQMSLDDYKVLAPRVRWQQQALDRAYPLLEAAPDLVDVLYDLLNVTELNMDDMEDETRATIQRAHHLIEQVKGDSP